MHSGAKHGRRIEGAIGLNWQFGAKARTGVWSVPPESDTRVIVRRRSTLLARTCGVIFCFFGGGCSLDVPPSIVLVKQMDKALPQQWGRTEQEIRNALARSGSDVDTLIAELVVHWGQRTRQYDVAFVSLLAECARSYSLSDGTIRELQEQIAKDPRLARQVFLQSVLVESNKGELGVEIGRLQHEKQRSLSEVCKELRSKRLGSANSCEAFYWLLFLAGMFNRPEMVLQNGDESVRHRLERAIDWVETVAPISEFSLASAHYYVGNGGVQSPEMQGRREEACVRSVMACFGKVGLRELRTDSSIF